MEFDYRDFLAKELRLRTTKNPAYSLRCFARDLDVAPSRLSEIINKKRGTSLTTGAKMAQKLGLTAREQTRFFLSIESLHSKSLKKKKSAKQQLKNDFNISESELTLDQFAIISEWYHFSILEILRSDIVAKTAEEISQLLNLKKNTVENALKRLTSLNLITKKNHQYQVNYSKSFTPSQDVPSKALKMHHEQIMQLANKALWEQDPQRREFGSVTMAFNPKHLQQAKEIIRNCKRQLATLADQSVDKTTIYALALQFFQITKGD